MLNLQDIVAKALWDRFHGELLLSFFGNLHASANRIGYPTSVDEKSIVFLQTNEFVKECIQNKFAIAFIEEKLFSEFKPDLSNQPHAAVFIVQNLKEAQRQVLVELLEMRPRPDIESTPSWVSPLAQIGRNVQIGAFATIHRHAVIGDNVIIGDHCVIEEFATIGEKTKLEAAVTIRHHCLVGKNCVIASQTVIGADGFGFIPGRVPKKIPQVGIVVIEDEVEIGALCSIDRAALGETRIGHGTKIDNHAHIAHNCVVGKGCLLAAGFWMAGSSTVGDSVYTGGGVHLIDHVHVASGTMLGARSGVSKNIVEPASYTGYPLQSVQDSLRTTQNLTHLTSMRKRLFKLEKTIEKLQRDEREKK